VLRVLDLFSGIGGFSRGLEMAGGFETVAFCEIEPFCQRVLAKHWPHVPCYPDVRELTSERLAADGIAVDVICGGFPCQDISLAGNGEGLAGERSGLWFEYARLIGELRPSYVIVENVAALLGRGLDAVLGSMASLGYDAEWHCIPASAFGASHRRDRLWVVAYPDRQRCGEAGELRCDQPTERIARRGKVMADTASIGHPRQGVLTQWCRAETNGARQAAYALSGGELGEWPVEPELGRVANGIPDRAHRLKGLGNAVVPQIPELIGRAIIQAGE
jgi:DNA (cytosine-5)-methyltransferase 1